VIVVGSIAREKVAVGAALMKTLVAVSLGVVAVTFGPAVVNCHVTGAASAIPSAALTVASSFAV
jgi:hypothetical protein